MFHNYIVLTLGILFFGLIFYKLGKLIGLRYSFLPDYGIHEFLTIWISFTGLLLTVLVLFKVNLQKTKTGEDFIDLLIGEMSLLKSNDKITIISPNINIGAFQYKTRFGVIIEAFRRAKKRGVLIEFISLGIDDHYLASYSTSQITTGTDARNFFIEGLNNRSPLLKYLHDRYEDGATKEDFDTFINQIQDVKLTICSINQMQIDFCHEKFVGFFTPQKGYIATYTDVREEEGKVKVVGEVIDTRETNEVIQQFLVDGLILKYSLR